MIFSSNSLSLYSYLFAIILFSACQSEPKAEVASSGVPSIADSEKLYVNYYVRYMADEKKLKAEVSFFSGAKKQKRNPKTFSEVSLNRVNMRLDETSKANPYYKIEQNKAASARANFQFITESGIQEKDLVVIPSLASISFGTELSRKKDGLVRWEGEPLGDKESLILLFTNEQERTTSTVINGPSEKSEIVIPSTKLQKIGLGKNRVYIVRKNRIIENKKSLGGLPREIRALTEFYSETIELNIVE